MSYALKFVAAAIGVLVVGGIVVLLFEGVWLQIGLGAAFLIVVGGLLLLAWFYDRKEKQKRAGVDELPRV